MLPLTLEAPTKDGYTFLGWNDGTNDVTGIPTGTTGTVSLTAKWDELSYSISYNLDGGVLSGDYPTSYTASTGLDTLPAPTKDGYAFLGWNDGTNDVAGIPVGTTGTVSLTARWEKLYTITYNLDGGTLSAGAPTTYISSAGLSTLPTPTKDGYVFAGWQEINDVPVTINDNWGKNEDGSIYIDYYHYDSSVSTYAPPIGLLYEYRYNSIDFAIINSSTLKFKLQLKGNGEVSATAIYQIVKDEDVYFESENYKADYTSESEVVHELPSGNYQIIFKSQTHASSITNTALTSTTISNLSLQEATEVASIQSGTTGNKTLTAKWEKAVRTFTIAGTSYQTEEGMTWEEWVNSAYNTGGFYISNNGSTVLFSGGSYGVSKVNSAINAIIGYVSPREVIILDGSVYYSKRMML